MDIVTRTRSNLPNCEYSLSAFGSEMVFGMSTGRAVASSDSEALRDNLLERMSDRRPSAHTLLAGTSGGPAWRANRAPTSGPFAMSILPTCGHSPHVDFLDLTRHEDVVALSDMASPDPGATFNVHGAPCTGL